ncbi:MAG: hypothetical protein KKD05_06850 [Candidatus Omnitrophica bacterium]|nr:hypothetical protein [Candidatus Omnitrophota bacterium]
MNLIMLSFIVPIVCLTLALVTSVLKIIKRMSLQIDQMEIKLLDIESRMR